MSVETIVLLAAAGFLAGALNAAAGGGSLISFPALIAVGYPPLTANVTNNIAVAPGYVTGATGYRRELRGQGHRILPLTVASAIGSLVGVGLILISSQSAFESIVPFLVLAACVLLAFQPAITRRLEEHSGDRDRPGSGVLAGQALAAVYGGYFSAALGVVVLAVLGLAFDDTLQRLNALKALLQLIIGAVSAVGFALVTPVAWTAVAVVAPASVVGGEVGARLARRVSDRALRVGIVTYGVACAVWLFVR
ncbi:MAG: sulfite exporter TauE/SafE family protein [Actinomycetota bacterium]|nr:sulfite exporter TauE/SafE family protein [Actinomycetota bacterium]MDQ3861571.1 sulfite exporter TauE/SafE family protein [Actinomycetota bacterium]MDQ5813975.1 sulfite exporter TauE/SafE family protein [Actinomycetota bacterium]